MFVTFVVVIGAVKLKVYIPANEIVRLNDDVMGGIGVFLTIKNFTGEYMKLSLAGEIKV